MSLIVISGPSGSGKNTLITKLIKKLPSATRVITTTTRSPRSQEVEGIDYYFIDKKSFEEKIKQGDFVEYNNFAGNFYGTDKNVLERTLMDHEYVFAAIDVNGKKSLEQQNIEHVSIFIMPESLNILEERIKKRGSINEKQLQDRLDTAHKEIEAAQNYDTIIVNKEGGIDNTVREVMGFLGLL